MIVFGRVLREGGQRDGIGEKAGRMRPKNSEVLEALVLRKGYFGDRTGNGLAQSPGRIDIGYCFALCVIRIVQRVG